MTNERGSILVETLASTGFAALVLSGGLALCLFLFARTWLKRTAYETAVCLAVGNPRSFCEVEMRAAVDTALPVGHLYFTKLNLDTRQAEVEMKWKASSFSISVSEVLRLPLAAKEMLP